MPDHSAPSGFDAVADRYDAEERDNLSFSYMRARSYLRLGDAFPPGARLIDVGSGTGTEAARLVARGADVALVDASARLLDLAAAKVRAVRASSLLGTHLMPARRLGELASAYGRASFDGAYSSLGPLNCEPDLRPVAEALAELIRPGGALVLSLINRVCAVEVAWFAAHADWRAAGRRWHGPVSASTYAGGPRDVATWYHRRAEIQRVFAGAGAFSIELVEALPLLWPPTYLDFLVKRFPRVFGVLDPIDRTLSRWPLLRDLGDHLLLRLRRS